jgi:hypothetical protein
MDEAQAWLHRGGRVEVFTEAIPWPDEPPADNALAAYKRRRSFPASSGTLPIRVIVSLMATFAGACPNLLPDMRCGVYEHRPRACRVYPAEVNPFIALDPAAKLCPPEAWQTDDVLQVDHAIVGMREADFSEAAMKAALCQRLAITTAGLSNEGVVAHAPSPQRLLDALAAVMAGDVSASTGDWTFVSHRAATRTLLDSAGTTHVAATALADVAATFMPFVPGDGG